MPKIKLCGLTRPVDIEAANSIKPEYIGFVFAPKSRRYLDPERARDLRAKLDDGIEAVGVFVREDADKVAWLLNEGIIDMAQLHGGEDEDYIRTLRGLTDKEIMQAFRIDNEEDVARAVSSSADLILLDSGDGGTGTSFDWTLLEGIERPFFLAGGLDADKMSGALKLKNLYGLDVSSGIETDGVKDPIKMTAFAKAARGE